MATTVLLESTTLKDIAAAVADELMLDDVSEIKVSQVSVTVVYSVDHKKDFIDEWYESYLARLDEEDTEVPF